MSKPKPKREVTVTQITGIPYGLKIMCASDDAVNWVTENCGEYGSFMQDMQYPNTFKLFVMTEVYDLEEVREYIERQGM